MSEHDSEEQGLNCKIITAKVSIPNVADFLYLLKAIALKYDVTIQVMDAELIAGEAHILSAVRKALRAVAKNKSITSDLGLEILLYASGRRQIERAFAMGVSEGEKTVAFVIVDAQGGKDLDTVAGEVRTRIEIEEEPIPELDSGYNAHKKEKLEAFFDITEAELKAVGKKKLKMLVLERVAMLDVLK